MNAEIKKLMMGFRSNEQVPANDLDSVEDAIGFGLPKDYRDYLTATNGGEGFIGKQYLIMWRVGELIPFNRDYQVSEFAPGLFLFASSGGGEGFGFDTRCEDMPIVQVPFIGLDVRHAKKVADNFTNLLVRMNSSNGSLF